MASNNNSKTLYVQIFIRSCSHRAFRWLTLVLTNFQGGIVVIYVLFLIIGCCCGFGGNSDPKALMVIAGSVCAIMGAILTALAENDDDACVNLRNASIWGTVLTGIGIFLAAITSLL